MEAIKEVKYIIENLDVVQGLNSRIFMYGIPEEEKADDDITDFLLEESESQPDGYGDSQFNEYSESIDITIFYAQNFPMNPSKMKFEILLQQACLLNGYYVETSGQHYLDPETKQIIKTLSIKKTQSLEQLL